MVSPLPGVLEGRLKFCLRPAQTQNAKRMQGGCCTSSILSVDTGSTISRVGGSGRKHPEVRVASTEKICRTEYREETNIRRCNEYMSINCDQ